MTAVSSKSVMNDREAKLTENEVFDRFTEEARPFVFSQIMRSTGCLPQKAEDLTQDIFVQAWGARAQFKGQATPSTWLHKITTNMIHNDYRTTSRRLQTISLETSIGVGGSGDGQVTSLAQAIPAQGIAVDDGIIRNQFQDMVRAAVRRLPVEYRTAVALIDLEEVSYSEASAILGVKEGTVKSRLNRGREKLAALIAPELRAIPG